MRDNPDVVGHRWLQVFKVPFVTGIADFFEPLLRLRDRNVFGLGMQNVDFNFAFANWPFPRCCGRQRICKRRVTDVRIV